MSYNMRINETAARLDGVELNYCHLFEAAAPMNGGEPVYSVQVRIPKSDTKTVALFEEIVSAAVAQGVSSKWGGRKPGKLTMPLRDGDEEKPEDESYAGKWFFNCKSTKRPGVQILENGKRYDAMPDDVQSTDTGMVAVNAYAYDVSGNRGIGIGLNGVIRTGIGARTFGGPSMDAMFGDLGEEDF